MTTISRALFLLLGTAVIGHGQSYSKCDILHQGATNVVDVQAIINEALGVSPPNNDLDGDGVVNVVDVQIVINAALGLGCPADPQPAITSFSPASAPIGTLVTVAGANLLPSTGAAQITLAQQGGGTIAGPIASASATTLTFVIPAGAATGAVQVTTLGNTASSSTPLTVVPSSTFSVTASPGSANLIRGQSITYSVSLTSTGTFTQLAALSVTGLPTGATAAFVPAQISLGQTSVLTVSAPLAQPTGSSTLTVTAAATVSGIPVTSSATVTLNVIPVSTSFRGRTVVDNTTQTSLAGVTVSTVGQNGAGLATGCTGYSTTSDASGNFALTNLPAACLGPQLIGFNGNTVTSPPGIYAGLQLVFTLVSNTVVVSPVLVNLPQVNTAETFNVIQNDTVDQTYSFTTIPGLSVTVYAGTVFTESDGSKPNPFPLAAIQVPVDRLPDVMPTTSAGVTPFIVAFQPAETNASQAVAVSFPNTLNVAPGTDMPLMTLDPTQGRMVPYGTGTVSTDGTTIIPDINPATSPHRYGIVHFDWHGPMPPDPPTQNPSPPPCDPTAQCCSGAPCATAGQPIDLSSGVDIIRATDIAINGPRGSVSVVRTFRTMSTTPGPFGIGSTFNYGYYLLTFAFITTSGPITLVTPDGNQFSFNPLPNGTLTNTTTPSLIDAVMTTPSSGVYNLRWKNGTVYQFQSLGIGNRTAYFTSIADPNGNTISLTLNGSQQVAQVTDPVGRSLNLSYDTSNRIVSVTDPIARSVLYTYNSAGYLTTVTDPAGGITTYTYDNQNNLLAVKDPRGIVTEQNTYDANGRVVQQVQADGGTYHFAYTLTNSLVPTSAPTQTIVTDPLGRQTTYRFNSNQLFTDATDPSGQTKTFVLDPAHSNLVSAVSGTAVCASCGTSSHGSHTYTLDSTGNILTNTDALGNTTTYTYEPVFSKVTSITDPLGDMTNNTYDSQGNLLTTTDPNGNTTSYTYNTFGQVTQSTDPTGAKTTFSYDGIGNLTTVADALGNTTSTVYDAISRPIQSIDALGRRSQTAYDALSRIVSQTNAQNNRTRFTYDAASNLVSTTDARGNTTSFTYDPMNRLLARTTPLGTSDSRTYDLNGNLITFRDRRGQTSSFAYDSLNRLVSETYADSTVVRSYDANGRLLQASDSASGLFAFTYDSAGRLTGSTASVGALQYTYDVASRLITRQVVGQAPVNYAYDRNSNLLNASITGASISRTYDPRNLQLTARRANGVTSQETYDALGRVILMTHAGPGGVLDNETYAYDPVGNRLGSATGIAQSLITQAVASAAYDANNEQNQFGPTTNAFDANGNLALSSSPSESTTYAWDSRNRLSSITTSGGQNTRFTYDFAGNLIQQTDAGSSLNLTQTFVLDDLTNVAFVSRSDGDQYSVLAGRSIDDHIAATHVSGQVEYGLADALNSTVATADQGGALKGRFLYEPFGETTSTGSTYPFQYTGRTPAGGAEDYYRARYYSTQGSRFISEDPLFLTSTRSAYSYADNQPLSRTDPLGLSTIYPEPPTGGKPPFRGPPIVITLPVQDPCLNPITENDCRPIRGPDPPAPPRVIKCTIKPECTFTGGACTYSCPGRGEVTVRSIPEAPCANTITVPLVGPLH